MRPRGKVTINLETGSRGVSIVGLVTPTLLIVDDEKSTRDGLRTALEDKFDVYAAPVSYTHLTLPTKRIV